jgi:signal transduction histidine kinase
MDSYFYNLAASLALTGVTCLLLGLFVLWRKWAERLGIVFFLWCLSISWWSLFELVIITRTNPEDAFFWSRIMQAGDIFLPTLFVEFVITLLDVPTPRWKLVGLYATSLLFAILCFTPLIIQGVGERASVPYFITPGPLYLAMVIFFASCVLYAQFILFRSYYYASGQNKAKLGYLFWSSVAGYIGGCMNFLLVFKIEIPVLYSYGTYAVTAFALATAYAILRYRLMDITLVFQKGLAYGLLMGALIPAYFVILGLVWIFTGTFQYVLSGMLVVAFTTFAGLLVNLQKRLQVVVAKALFPQQHNAYDALKDYSTAMRSILDLKALTERTIAILARALGSAKISLFLLDKEKDEYVLKAAQGIDESQLRAVTITSNHLLPQYLQQMGQAILKEEVQHSGNKLGGFSKGITTMLEALECELCLPLQNQGRLMGFVNLGPKPHRAMFTREDLENLSILAASAASAFANAAFHEQEKEEQRRERHDERAHAFETIAGGFAHEIRNPLVSINTFLQLVPLRKDDLQFMDEFRKVAMNDSARIERLSGEVLGFARLHEPQRHEERLNDVVVASLRAIENRAQSHGVALITELAGDLPPVWIDSQQILQVLGNLINNALDAMEAQKGGQLITRTRRLVKPEGVWVQFEITDSGCGMPPDTLEKIFVPFFTTKHESKEREGTGLGLPICQRIIVAHGGYIEVKSELGKSTTFSVNLPLRQSQKILQAIA